MRATLWAVRREFTLSPPMTVRHVESSKIIYNMECLQNYFRKTLYVILNIFHRSGSRALDQYPDPKTGSATVIEDESILTIRGCSGLIIFFSINDLYCYLWGKYLCPLNIS